MPQTLAQLVRAKFPGAYDDLSDQQLESMVKAKFPGAYDDVPTTTADTKTAQPPNDAAKPTLLDKAGHYAAEALPSVGGIIGGIGLGVPGAIVGGAAGEGFRQLAEHASEIPGAIKDVASNLLTHPIATAQGAVSGTDRGALSMAGEGATQGAGQLLGEGVSAGGGVMAKWLMNRATSRVSAKLIQDFPELSDTLIDNALTVSNGGYAKAKSLLLATKSKATAALKAADDAGATIPIGLNDDLAQSFKTALLEDAVKGKRLTVPPGQPLTTASERLDPATKALYGQIDAALSAGKPLDLTPSQADLLKTQLQKESRALYANRTAPNGPKAMGMDATERADFATQLNSAIDQVATGYKAANAEAKPLIGAVRGIKQAIRPNGNLLQAMVRPAVGATVGANAGGVSGYKEGGGLGAVLGASAGGVAGAALTSPAGMSREAIILASPMMQGVLKALPKPLAQGLLDLLATHLGESQSPAAGK